MTRSLPLLAILLAACGDPPPDDSVDVADAAPDAASDAPVGPAPAQLPPEIVARSTRGIAFADDGTVFLWGGGGAGIARARPPTYALEYGWMPTPLGLHSELEVLGPNLYFILEGTLRRVPVDAPSGVAPSAPLASGLDSMALTSSPDGTLYYSKEIITPVPGGGSSSRHVFRLPPTGTEDDLVINDDGVVGDLAWHDGQLYIVSFAPHAILAVDLAASPHTTRVIGERTGGLVYGIAADAAGRIYYGDTNRAFRFDPATGENEVLATSGILLAESVAIGRGPLDATDVYLAAMPNVLLRGVAAP